MSENEITIRLVVESLQDDFKSNGEIAVITVLLDKLGLGDDTIEDLACSCIQSERDEGIYYDPKGDRYFFYGESQAYSYGGRKYLIHLDDELLPLIPSGVQAVLKKVAKTGQPRVFTLNDSHLLDT